MEGDGGVLGSGNFGQVLRMQMGIQVAVKVALEEDSPELLNEARAAASIGRHPSLLAAHGLWRAPVDRQGKRRTVLVLELADGCLADLLKCAALPPLCLESSWPPKHCNPYVWPSHARQGRVRLSALHQRAEDKMLCPHVVPASCMLMWRLLGKFLFVCLAVRSVSGLITVLSARSEQPDQPAEVVVSMLEQLTEAVDHVHRAGWAHLDIKKENVMMKGDMVKLGDFGGSLDLQGPLTGYTCAPLLQHVFHLGACCCRRCPCVKQFAQIYCSMIGPCFEASLST